jgi:hypothetical protein
MKSGGVELVQDAPYTFMGLSQWKPLILLIYANSKIKNIKNNKISSSRVKEWMQFSIHKPENYTVTKVTETEPLMNHVTWEYISSF